MRATSFTNLAIFSKVPYWKFFDRNFVNVSPEQLQGTLITAFWNALYSSGFYGHANSFIKTLANIMKRKSTKVPWKLSLAKKYNPTLQITLHQNRWLFFFYQNDLHVLLTKQFYKINCEIIKIKINREKSFNKTMTKQYKTLTKSFGC